MHNKQLLPTFLTQKIGTWSNNSNPRFELPTPVIWKNRIAAIRIKHAYRNSTAVKDPHSHRPCGRL